jgi:hypothetical protein
MRISSSQLSGLTEQVKQLAARLNEKVNGPIGITSIRAFLKGEPDPAQHLGPPKSTSPQSMRWLLYGQPDEAQDDEKQS